MSSKILKVRNIYGEMDEAMAEKFLEAINDKEATDLEIYFTCTGGDVDVADFLADALNRSDKKIVVTVHHVIFSAAMLFVFKLDKKIELRYLPENLVGMVHLLQIGSSISTKGTGYSPSDRARIHHMKQCHELYLNTLRGFGITEEEIKRVDNDEDVYFDTARMIELIENRNK